LFFFYLLNPASIPVSLLESKSVFEDDLTTCGHLIAAVFISIAYGLIRSIVHGLKIVFLFSRYLLGIGVKSQSALHAIEVGKFV
jgi:hypothetical protein